MVVSGAAGATGSTVGQIAKIKGAAKVIGIAGGPQKCAWIVDELGFDEAIDYKTENVAARLREARPTASTCTSTTSAARSSTRASAQLALRGRIVLCGAISGYNDAAPPRGPANYVNLIIKRGRMEGFLILDYFDRLAEAQARWRAGWPKARSNPPSTSSRAWRTRPKRSTCCSPAATPAR